MKLLSTCFGVMLRVNLDLKNFVGNSVDGAANIQGLQNFQYSAIKAPLFDTMHMSKLNLVVSEATSIVVTSESLFSLFEYSFGNRISE